MNTRSFWYWLSLALILGWMGIQGYQSTLDAKPAATAKAPQTLPSEAYMGIQKVSAAKVKELFPDSNGKPLLLMFHSKYCFDCKRMKPVIETLVPKHKGLVFKSYDVLEDKEKQARIFSAFKPVSVPILLFIKPNGETAQILYNYQKTAVVESNLSLIGG